MVNKHLEMNIQTIPKPIKYKFKDSRRDGRSVEKSEKSEEEKSEKSEEKKSDGNGTLDSMEVVDEAPDENEDVTEREEKPNDVKQEEVFDVETSDQASVKKETKPVRIP